MLPQVFKNIFEMQRKRSNEEKKRFGGGGGLLEFLFLKGFFDVFSFFWILLEFLYFKGFGHFFLGYFIYYGSFFASASM